MSDSDFDEFYNIVGKEIPVYRECPECDEIYIVDPDTYDKPKIACDPGYCPYHVPICLCDGGDTLYSFEALDDCHYPNCRCSHGK